MQGVIGFLRATYDAWNKDRAERLAAALAFYITFALAPFVIVMLEIAGLVLGSGDAPARAELSRALTRSAGAQTAREVLSIVDAIRQQPHRSILAAITGWSVVVIAAMGLFGAIQDALNTVWERSSASRGLMGLLRDRFISFAMVAGIALLLIVSLFVNAVIASFIDELERLLPGFSKIYPAIGLGFTLAVTMCLIAAIYKWLPDARLHWEDVAVGAVATTVLLGIGEFVLGWYLSHAGWTSVYGAAGSLVLSLLWVYYSAQIFLLGAELTKIYSLRRQAARHAIDPRRPAVIDSPTHDLRG